MKKILSVLTFWAPKAPVLAHNKGGLYPPRFYNLLNLAAFLLLCGGILPTAVAQDKDRLTIDPPAHIRTVQNNDDGALLTLQVNNIQVRAEWSVTPADLFTIYADGELHFIGNINQTVNVDVNVMVKDKFNDLNDAYTDLMAQAVINMTLIPEKAIFVLGGGRPNNYFNDVSKSSDGQNWNEANTLWAKLSGHQAVVHQGTIYVLGGDKGGSITDEVWSSTDGNTWIMLGTAAWSPRADHRAVVHGDRIYVLGGYDGSYKNDVWASTDGISWSAITLSANWSGRQLHQAVSYQGRLYVLGGNPRGLSRLNDVWSSADGSIWSQETDAINGAEWTGRYGHQAVVHQGSIYVLGGNATHKGRANDVWSSVDGKTWAEVETEGAKWEGRQLHQAASYKGHLYVLGGNTTSYKKDVWSSVDGSEWSLETNNFGGNERYSFQAIVFP